MAIEDDSIRCRSRSPLTQRVSLSFDVCGIWLGGVFVKRRVRTTRILAVGHCNNKSSWDVFELSQRASDLTHSPFVMEFCSLLLCRTCSSPFTLPSSCEWSVMKIEQRIGGLPVVLFHIFPSTLSPHVRLVPGALGSVRGTLRGSFGWPLLTCSAHVSSHLVVQMLSSFLRSHVGSLACSVTCCWGVVRIQCSGCGVNRT